MDFFAGGQEQHVPHVHTCRNFVQVKTATDLFRQVEEKVLGVAHGNSEDLDGMSHDRERAKGR